MKSGLTSHESNKEGENDGKAEHGLSEEAAHEGAILGMECRQEKRDAVVKQTW